MSKQYTPEQIIAKKKYIAWRVYWGNKNWDKEKSREENFQALDKACLEHFGGDLEYYINKAQ